MSVVERVIERLDGWANAATGLGGQRDKLTSHAVTAKAQLDEPTLEALYNDDAIAAKIVDKVPRTACRAGFGLRLPAASSGDATTTSHDIVSAVKALDGLRKLRDAWIWGRLYGAGGVLIGADDGGDLTDPLDLQRVRTVKFLNVLRRTQLQIERYYDDVNAPRYGEPEQFRVLQLSASTHDPRTGNRSAVPTETLIHESRLILFGGATTARLQSLSGSVWDDSVLQRVFAAVQQNSSSWMSVAHLMTDASQGVLKIANLMQLIAAGGESQLRKRMQLMDICRSVCRSILVDAEKESFERVATSFTGLPEVLDRFMVLVAAAADMPVTELWGRSPAGMNATGESDTRSWYDTVAEARDEHLAPRLEYLLRVVMSAKDGPTKGRLLDGWSLEFPPLWQPTDNQKADRFKTISDALVALSTAQIIMTEEAALRLAHDGLFPEIDVESREEAMIIQLERIRNPPEPPDPDDDPLHDPDADPSKQPDTAPDDDDEEEDEDTAA